MSLGRVAQRKHPRATAFGSPPGPSQALTIHGAQVTSGSPGPACGRITHDRLGETGAKATPGRPACGVPGLAGHSLPPRRPQERNDARLAALELLGRVPFGIEIDHPAEPAIRRERVAAHLRHNVARDKVANPSDLIAQANDDRVAALLYLGDREQRRAPTGDTEDNVRPPALVEPDRMARGKFKLLTVLDEQRPQPFS